MIRCILLVVCLMSVSCSSTADPASDAPRPNIVLIMADDLGYGDLSCYGSEQFGPQKQGFETFKGFVSGNVDYFNKIDQEAHKDWYIGDELKHVEGYVTDLVNDDLGENNDLADQQPDRVKEMRQAHEEWLIEVRSDVKEVSG